MATDSRQARRSVDLFVVRHAIAFDPHPEHWPDDAERPLTEEGEDSFRRAARGLGAIAPVPVLVLASPFARAFRTAEILSKEAGWPSPEPCEALRSGEATDQLIKELRTHDQTPLAVVGHEPDLSALIKALSGALVEMKKGGVARLTVDAWGRGRSTLRWLLPPKALRAIRS